MLDAGVLDTCRGAASHTGGEEGFGLKVFNVLNIEVPPGLPPTTRESGGVSASPLTEGFSGSCSCFP